jgi:hypothetical protein
MNAFRKHILTLPQLAGEVAEPFMREAAQVLDDDFLPPRWSALHLVGCGDSYFAALATEFAFVIYRRACRPKRTMRCRSLRYKRG